ncbi:plexin-2-like isoform X2 [Ptychodera flava]|uniref:plexin-2-like isoform X2 n=1 Tax=Ptychodera flava TaxID=63121 RepID=UPI00396A716F
MSNYGNYHLVFVHLIVIVIGSSFGQSGPKTCSYACIDNNSLCYESVQICDRFYDCPGGDDEIDCGRKTAKMTTQTPTPLDPTTSTEVRQNSTVNSHRNISAEGTEQTTLSTLEPSTSEETSTEASPTVRTSPTRMVREIISITPSVGPVSGGTEIIIEGPNVNVDVLSVFIAGRPCNIRDNETKNWTICYTSRVDEPIESAITMVYKNRNLTSDRVFSYKPDPEISAITPLKQFQTGGQKQTIRGENLNIIGRPVFVVTAIKNATSLEFNSSCKAENSTTMICLSPNISFSDQNNSNAVSGVKDMQTKKDRQNTTARVKRGAEDDCIAITSSYVSGEYVEFTVGFYLDGVEKWRPQNIGRYLDKKYTTYAVMEDPVINKFPGENNIYSIGEDTQYLVITGERLNCGAQKEDFTVEVGVDYCHPIISLHSRQLTCKPPGKKPPLKFDNEANYGHPHVRVKIGNVRQDIGYLRYVVVQPWMLALAVIAAFLLIVAVTLTVVYLFRRNSRHRSYKTEERYIGLRPIGDETIESTKRKGKDTTFHTLDLDLQLRVKDVIIESERLFLPNDNILGRGYFGVVMSGSLQTTQSSECTPGYEGLRQEVAVKLLKHNADQDELVNFLEEGLMMKDLQHSNVLTLIGICIDGRGVSDDHPSLHEIR